MCRQLWMCGRIDHSHTLGHGGVIEGLVSRNQGNRTEASRLTPPSEWCSRMMVSERGSPLIVIGWSSGSSKSASVSESWLIKPISNMCCRSSAPVHTFLLGWAGSPITAVIGAECLCSDSATCAIVRMPHMAVPWKTRVRKIRQSRDTEFIATEDAGRDREGGGCCLVTELGTLGDEVSIFAL